MAKSKWKENFQNKEGVCYVDNQDVEYTYEEIKKWAFDDDTYVDVFYQELIGWESRIPPGTLMIINQQENAFDFEDFDQFDNMPHDAKLGYVIHKLEQIANYNPHDPISKDIIEQTKLLSQLL